MTLCATLTSTTPCCWRTWRIRTTACSRIRYVLLTSPTLIRRQGSGISTQAPAARGFLWTTHAACRTTCCKHMPLPRRKLHPLCPSCAKQVSYFDSYTANADMPMALETGATHQRPTITGSVPGA